MMYEQDLMWKGEFGDAYTKRNKAAQILASDIHLFAKILKSCERINEILEFGSNIGLNLMTLSYLLPHVNDISAIEINEEAARECQENVNINNMYIQSIHDFIPDYKRDFVLSKSILINLPPKSLQMVYEKLYESSKKYICICEYYNPTPVEVEWRGYSNMLFKRDFCGEMMDKYPDLKLVNYGFVYHRDYNFPQDDINWFLLKK